MKREPIWWLPLLRRTMLWGVTLVALLSLLVMVCVGVPLVLMAGPDHSATGVPGGAWRAAVAVLEWLRLPCALAFVVGAASGLCAPPKEPKNPLRSPFFGKVVTETFLFSLAFSFFVVPISLVIWFSMDWSSDLLDHSISSVIALLVFAPSLALALNRALRATKPR